MAQLKSGSTVGGKLIVTADDARLAAPIDYSATLSTSWVGATAPYTQNISITGVLLNSKIDIKFPSNITATEFDAATNAKLHLSAQVDNQITITAFGIKPTITIPIIVRLL